MEVLKTLAVALSLGTLAGVNLYLTVLVTGLALHFDWVTLPSPLAGLEVLGHPTILCISAVLYAIEFCADKIPWVDTAWDAIHTLIRPIGAAALAVAAMGDAHPAFEVVAGLLAGGMAFSSHTAKAGTRLAANTSPEPFTNIAFSLVEDGLVLGGLGLLAWSPLVALVLAVIICATILIFLPRLLRNIFQSLRVLLKKARSHFG
jgi:hypothetical protein